MYGYKEKQMEKDKIPYNAPPPVSLSPLLSV